MGILLKIVQECDGCKKTQETTADANAGSFGAGLRRTPGWTYPRSGPHLHPSIPIYCPDCIYLAKMELHGPPHEEK